MLNQVTLVGRLVSDPEIIETETGTKQGRITLAVPRSYKNVEGIYETDFLECRLWTNVAVNTKEYCLKGDLVGIKGRLETETIEIENGKKVLQMYINTERVSFLSSKPKEREEENGD